ncbi:MAG TPA: DNA polymerase III subunit alpha [Candidatus Saccharibacteria bacterium]|nr:DNA polymerase III subunit alpha [Candidatus Saccharibacteria bacterium]HMR38218.1 DNA polymerase III subunit alpha [Candidatus Saccharibacteria bacterium]
MTATGDSTATVAALKPSDFVHLHNHTHHSLLDGLTKIPDLVHHVKEMGMEACAITDHGTLSGAIEFYKAAKDAGIKPIIGIETYVAARTIHDRDPSKDKARYHLILLAMNNTGYQNLMRLSTIANLEGFYYKPRIDHALLEQYNEGIIALSACLGGEVSEPLQHDDYEKAKEVASWYQSVFGDRYYLEIQDHQEYELQNKVNNYIFQLSEELGIKTVVSSDAHYVNADDQQSHEILLCVGTGAFMSDEKRMSLTDFHLHVTDPKDVIARWATEHPDTVSNTKEIADRCDIDIELGGILIPKFPTPNGESEKEFLDTLVYRGMAHRYLSFPIDEAETLSNDEIRSKLLPEHIERLDMEFAVLDKMGYNGYFLIVQDFINWGKNEGIIFGPGRGSAAGSIIAFALNITDLDPLKYDLLFERFLNPDRISMPDIDIDIQDTRRNEVIEYCAKKYGYDRVANICTFGTMAARGAVRDVARVLEVPYGDADRMAKLIPPPVQGRHIPLKVSVAEDPDLKREYENNPTAKTVFDYAITLEGTIRSHGVHAAGVVIAPDDLVKFVPLEMAQKGVVATQYPMGPVEELGLLKMDFLGLSNLSIINNALRIVRKVYKTDIDLSTLPLDDEKTYELFQRGDTTGVFQLESAGMKRYLRELKPSVFEDIIAMVALYRPGPMQFIDSFIKRKHGEEPITYLHSGMENSLKNTYGILVYQEQFMQISKEWCGFTGGQADTLRKAVGKKKIDLMQKVKPEFVEGAVKVGGATKEIAETFWDQLEEFANYCFNKSHAACYGLIAYWTAYLKAHYPDAFMAALMTSDRDDTDRLAIEIAECQHMGISVLSPDINESFVEFAVVPGNNEVRFGLAAIKGVGTAAVEEILRAREEAPFKGIEDFVTRVSTNKVNKKTWESLVKGGAFDEMGDRSDILFNVEDILAFGSKIQKERLSSQADLFGALEDDSSVRQTIELRSAPTRHSEKETLMWERELLGLYISAHPLDNYESFFREQTIPLTQVTKEIDGQSVTVGGIISTVRTIVTKNGKKMAFVGIEDKMAEGEVIVFPNLYDQLADKLVQDAIIKVTGKVNARDRDGNMLDEAKIIADEINIITDKELMSYESTGENMKAPTSRAPYRRKVPASASASKPKATTVSVSAKSVTASPPPVFEKPQPQTLYLRVENPEDTQVLLNIKSTCSDYPGSDEVILVVGGDKKALRMPFKIGLSNGLESQLVALLGKDAVVIK